MGFSGAQVEKMLETLYGVPITSSVAPTAAAAHAAAEDAKDPGRMDVHISQQLGRLSGLSRLFDRIVDKVWLARPIFVHDLVYSKGAAPTILRAWAMCVYIHPARQGGKGKGLRDSHCNI